MRMNVHFFKQHFYPNGIINLSEDDFANWHNIIYTPETMGTLQIVL